MDGRRYEDLHAAGLSMRKLVAAVVVVDAVPCQEREESEAHLLGLPALSVHLKIDTEGSEWPVLASPFGAENKEHKKGRNGERGTKT